MLNNVLFLKEYFESINLYGICIGVGLLACFGVLYWFSRIRKVDSRFVDFVFYDGVASIAIGFFFAALFQAFYNYLDNPEKGFRFGSGITFIGGLIGGAGAFLAIFYIFKKFRHGTLADILPIAPCCIVIAHAFGRIGCFFGKCCYGAPTDSIFGVVFFKGDVPRHPTMLYESFFLFVLFAVLTILLLKKNYKQTLNIYLIAYGIFRFLIEYLRDDKRGSFIGALSPSQFWSIVMIIVGIGLYFAPIIVRKIKAKSNAKS